MLEKQIEDNVCRYARERGFLAMKFSSPARAAVPDRILIYKGQILFIEFKREGAVPTSAQAREHTRLREHGAPVFVVDNVTRGRNLIDMIAMGLKAKDVTLV